jgi:predicted DNA-binding transcriptional regulator AlpA
MLEKHLSVADLCEQLGIGRTTLWRMVRDGRIQPPRRLSPARVAWPQSEIETYLANCQRSRAGGAT